MTVTAHTIRTALDTSLDGHALNRAQDQLVFNRSPEVDSLAERIVALRRHRVPDEAIRELLDDVRALLELNDAEDGCHRDLSGRLDDIAAMLHRRERDRTVSQTLGVKALARALSGPLDVVAAPADAMAFVAAVRAVDALISRVPGVQLLSASLGHELGARRHRLLVDLVEQRKAPA